MRALPKKFGDPVHLHFDDLVLSLRLSERTIERWIVDGLPTRNVFGSVRVAPADLAAWMRQRFGMGDAA